MKTKIFVRGLPWEMTEADLQELFGQYGDIQELKIITDRDTGKSRGFGFVNYANQAAAEAAIKQLNGSELKFRPLTVAWAEDKPAVRPHGRRR